MINKGFATLIAVCLFLACAFYLSFSVVTNHYENAAVEYAQGDAQRYNDFLDSMSTEKVWFGYTLKEAREKELNLGLDLKGGMNVILEVSIPDIVRSLGNTESENFNKAIEMAQQKQLESQDDFLDLFEQSFLELDPNAKLSSVFSTLALKDKVTLASTNKEVMDVLRDQVDAAVSNSFNILRTRIDRFGVVQPNIQRLQNAGRILVELPGIKEPERVRKLLQGTANLEFWETYELSEIAQNLVDADKLLATINAGEIVTDSVKTDTATSTQANVMGKADSLLAAMQAANAEGESQVDEQALEQAKKEHPLLAILQLNQDRSGNLSQGPIVGYARYNDTAKIREFMDLKQVKAVLPSGLRLKWGAKAFDDKGKYFYLYAIKCTNREDKAPLEGDVITDARDEFGEHSVYAKVNMTMNPEGANTWSRLTEENKGRCIAIVLDDYVYSAPRVNDKISGGRSEITGDFTVEEAKDLANMLKTGKMPAPAVIVQEDVVGPSLGQEAIESGLAAAVFAFILVLIYMIFFYGPTAGLVADSALVVNVFLLIGILASFKAVLTLPGITGIVLTLGMAVDTNVLIYERIREELRKGKATNKAIEAGYAGAASAIIDANITTIITGIVLFLFGTGPIKGFATTLIIGIVTSLLTGFVMSRYVYQWIIKGDKTNNLNFSTKLTKNLFQNIHFDFIGKRKIGYAISIAVILTGIVSLFVRGLNTGIDFTGGRNYVVKFDNAISTEEVKDLLTDAFDGQTPNVITIKSSEVANSDNRVRISTNFKINDNASTVDEEIEGRLYDGLKSQLKEGTTREQFVTENILSSQKVGASIADDIKASAVIAIFFALIAIALYILLRFRQAAFSMSGVVALAHDTMVIIGLFSLLYSIMPFSMEIDQAFIAAILTIVGYSINDTVVIFDRVREYRNQNSEYYDSRRSLAQTINDALNSTLCRTFNTSFTTLIVLLAIFIFGGESIRGFVFALLIGVLAGTYSSLFIATPLAYEVMKRKEQKSNKK